jgi:NAD(P)H-flavin reductase
MIYCGHLSYTVFVVVDKVAVKGPFPKLAYTPNMKKNVCMLAGGSGE